MKHTITLAHGAGGRAMRELISNLLRSRFSNAWLDLGEDQARIDLSDELLQGQRLAMTTDSYVITPLFFPGGDIGELAVTGTVNDLAVGGATARFLTCGLILEEGLPLETLERIVTSMATTAKRAGVSIVTGDTKVVPRGAADQCYINTAGVGLIPAGLDWQAGLIQPGDCLIVNGSLGEHGAAIAAARDDLGLSGDLKSDCMLLQDLVQHMLSASSGGIRCCRDITRGGLVSVANEFALACGQTLVLDERSLPVREPVRGLCEILGLDPLYLACEGRLLCVVAATDCEAVLAAMRAHPAGSEAICIGRVDAQARARVVLNTGLGGSRVLDLLTGEQLPRIC